MLLILLLSAAHTHHFFRFNNAKYVGLLTYRRYPTDVHLRSVLQPPTNHFYQGKSAGSVSTEEMLK